MSHFSLFCAFMLAFHASNEIPAELERFVKGLPRDARQFVIRKTICQHLGGEELYDSARRSEIETSSIRLRCLEIAKEQKHLLRKYAPNSKIRQRIIASDTLYL